MDSLKKTTNIVFRLFIDSISIHDFNPGISN